MNNARIQLFDAANALSDGNCVFLLIGLSSLPGKLLASHGNAWIMRQRFKLAV